MKIDRIQANSTENIHPRDEFVNILENPQTPFDGDSPTFHFDTDYRFTLLITDDMSHLSHDAPGFHVSSLEKEK